MAAVSFDAHLLLPSPLGLLEYDLLEEAVFVGPAPRGGLQARPEPFPGAVAAITATASGYVVRPMPGQAAPLVNNEASGDAALADGDRLRWGQEVAMFRLARGVVAATVPSETTARVTGTSERPARREAVAPLGGRNPIAWVLGLGALALVLLGVARAIEHLKTVDTAKTALRTSVPAPTAVPQTSAGPLLKELAQLREQEEGDTTTTARLRRYELFVDRHPDAPEADIARARLRELASDEAQQATAALDDELRVMVASHQYAGALKRVRAFETAYGDPSTSAATSAWRQRIRAAARERLDIVLKDVAPRLRRTPREAHRILLLALHQFPPDLSDRIVPLLDRAVVGMTRRHSGPAGRATPLEPRRAPDPDTPNPGTPLLGDPNPNAPGTGPADASGEPSVAERAARRTWSTTDLDLRRGRFAQARKGYDALLRLHADTRTVQDARGALERGLQVAEMAEQGPGSLLSVPNAGKGHEIDVTYSFDSGAELDDDWVVDQPFASTLPVKVEKATGEVRMRGASGVFHRLVYSDVRIEATAVAEVAKDFGLIALDDGPRYRAVLLNLNNTKFTLKKGAAARAQPGHVLWFIGEGVWAAADEGVHGYIKIAERASSKLQNMDRVRLELIRRGSHAEGTLEGRTDGVHLKGEIKGDDGSGLGVVHIGLFTNSGWLNVEEVRVKGTVDAAWFRAEVQRLVDDVPRPPRDG